MYIHAHTPRTNTEDLTGTDMLKQINPKQRYETSKIIACE